MTIAKKWAGYIYGTNTGNVFVDLDGEPEALTGRIHINDPQAGVAIYNVAGSYSDSLANLTGSPTQPDPDGHLGDITISGKIDSQGRLVGDWSSTIGTAGTFILFPHEHGESAESLPNTEQLHTARFDLGAVEIDRSGLISLAELVGKEFPDVVVTVDTGAEQARYLEAFRTAELLSDKAASAKIFARKPDTKEVQQVISIEFGPNGNFVMTQGANEAWVLGKLETLKRALKQFERSYVTNFKRMGFGLNQALLAAAIVFLPSLGSFQERAAFFVIVLGLIWGVTVFHKKYLPTAAITLRDKKPGILGRIGPSILSWFVGIVATVTAGLVGAYLEGALKAPEAVEIAEKE